MQDKDLDDFLQKVEADDNRQRKLGNKQRSELETRRNGTFTPREDSLLDISDVSNLMMVVDDSSVSSAAVSPVGYRVRKSEVSPAGYHDEGGSRNVNSSISDDSDSNGDDDMHGPENATVTGVVAESSPRRNYTEAKITNDEKSMKVGAQNVLHREVSKHENQEAPDSAESRSVPLKKFPARGKPREERVRIRSSVEIDMEAPLLPPRTVKSSQQRKEKLNGSSSSSSGALPPSLPQRGKRFRSGSTEEKVKPPVPRHIPALPSRSSKPVYSDNDNIGDNGDNKDNTSGTESIDSMQSETTDSTPPLIDLNDDDNDGGSNSGTAAPGDTPKYSASSRSKGVKELPPARKSIIVTGLHGSRGPESASLEAELHNKKRRDQKCRRSRSK